MGSAATSRARSGNPARRIAPPRTIRIAQLIAVVSAGALSFVSAHAQTTLLKSGASVDVCNSCDLDTQEKLASEDDRHDSQDSGFDAETRAENVEHDEADQAIEKTSATSEVKQEALANENERHQN